MEQEYNLTEDNLASPWGNDHIDHPHGLDDNMGMTYPDDLEEST